MVEQNKTQITEDEAKLYDRQIRLWGLDAQKRFVPNWFDSLYLQQFYQFN